METGIASQNDVTLDVKSRNPFRTCKEAFLKGGLVDEKHTCPESKRLRDTTLGYLVSFPNRVLIYQNKRMRTRIRHPTWTRTRTWTLHTRNGALLVGGLLTQLWPAPLPPATLYTHTNPAHTYARERERALSCGRPRRPHSTRDPPAPTRTTTHHPF